jgi:hypothetical protein
MFRRMALPSSSGKEWETPTLLDLVDNGVKSLGFSENFQVL